MCLLQSGVDQYILYNRTLRYGVSVSVVRPYNWVTTKQSMFEVCNYVISYIFSVCVADIQHTLSLSNYTHSTQ